MTARFKVEMDLTIPRDAETALGDLEAAISMMFAEHASWYGDVDIVEQPDAAAPAQPEQGE